MSGFPTLFINLFNRKKHGFTDHNLNLEDSDEVEIGDVNQGKDDTSKMQSEEEEYEVVEREILPNKIICPDCGGITLEGLDFCDKCGGEL